MPEIEDQANRSDEQRGLTVRWTGWNEECLPAIDSFSIELSQFCLSEFLTGGEVVSPIDRCLELAVGVTGMKVTRAPAFLAVS